MWLIGHSRRNVSRICGALPVPIKQWALAGIFLTLRTTLMFQAAGRRPRRVGGISLCEGIR